MQEMTAEEYRSFLLNRARAASLVTVRADGRPHVVPIWFDLYGDTFVFTAGAVGGSLVLGLRPALGPLHGRGVGRVLRPSQRRPR